MEKIDFKVTKGEICFATLYLFDNLLFVGPEYLTVSSSGPAGKEQYLRMGVYRQSGETHNNKPVWSRHDGTMKLFYDNGKFILS